jgi:hypothetical protein
MIPQPPIDQLPDEQLAVQGWNQYQALENATRQCELCRQNIQAIRQELEKRNAARQSYAEEAVDEKAAQQDALVEKLMAKLAERNGALLAKEPRAE